MLNKIWHLFFILLLSSASAFATTKGLNQIVTPDIQKSGEFSLSFQAQNPAIANPYEFQAELGINSFLEAAVFQGLNPAETIFNIEAALIQDEPYLLSAGFLGFSTNGAKAQPFLEAGYFKEHDKFMGGPIFTSQLEFVLGYAHDFNDRWRFDVDFQSGNENFWTVGVTYAINKYLEFNPAIYFSNSGTGVYAYGIVTYTFSSSEEK